MYKTATTYTKWFLLHPIIKYLSIYMSHRLKGHMNSLYWNDTNKNQLEALNPPFIFYPVFNIFSQRILLIVGFVRKKLKKNSTSQRYFISLASTRDTCLYITYGNSSISSKIRFFLITFLYVVRFDVCLCFVC
jgi:hypothetical protein